MPRNRRYGDAWRYPRSKVLDAADGNARQAVLTGLLGLLLALLDEETVYMLLLGVQVTDALRDIDRSAGTVR